VVKKARSVEGEEASDFGGVLSALEEVGFLRWLGLVEVGLAGLQLWWDGV
jgi:hypothetical protein